MISQFKEDCTKLDDISVAIIMRLFLSQTNLVFESNPVFMDILDGFSNSLITYLPFDF